VVIETLATVAQACEKQPSSDPYTDSFPSFASGSFSKGGSVS